MIEYRLSTDFRSGDVRYVLEADRLVVTLAKRARTESVPFSSIREINLRQEMPGVFTMRLVREDGPTLTIPSRHFIALGRFEDRSTEYVRFVRALHDGCVAVKSRTRFVAGSSLLFALGWIVVLGGALLGALFVVGVFTTSRPPPWRVLWVLPVAFLVGGAFLRQGRSRPYDPAAPPAKVFPVTG